MLYATNSHYGYSSACMGPLFFMLLRNSSVKFRTLIEQPGHYQKIKDVQLSVKIQCREMIFGLYSAICVNPPLAKYLSKLSRIGGKSEVKK